MWRRFSRRLRRSPLVLVLVPPRVSCLAGPPAIVCGAPRWGSSETCEPASSGRQLMIMNRCPGQANGRGSLVFDAAVRPCPRYLAVICPSAPTPPPPCQPLPPVARRHHERHGPHPRRGPPRSRIFDAGLEEHRGSARRTADLDGPATPLPAAGQHRFQDRRVAIVGRRLPSWPAARSTRAAAAPVRHGVATGPGAPSCLPTRRRAAHPRRPRRARPPHR
jgi:hypothetical protein